MTAARTYDLGKDGENLAARLLASIRLAKGLDPVLVLASSPTALAELRRRLQAATSRFSLLEPGPNILERIEELALRDEGPEAIGEARRRVLWIEAEPFDLEAWKETLVFFNRRREWLRARAPWLLVLAGPLVEGPTSLNELCARHAPDFYTVSTAHFLGQEPLLLESPSSRPIRWLHLSDFHFAAREGWDRRRTLKALLEYLTSRKKEGWRPDFVFATGDIANSGKIAEYDQATLFFRELAKVLEIDLARDLFLIPGNHDVDRDAKGPADDYILRGLLSSSGTEQQEQIAATLGDARTMAMLGRRLHEFYNFTDRLLGAARRFQADKPWRVDFRDVAGIEVAILQLNSAWASGLAEEKGRLLVGMHQLEEALAEASRSPMRIALLHHPLDYLADGDAGALRGRLKARGGAHFLLRGHLHESEIELSANPDGKMVELAAGAVYADTKWPKRFFLAEADLDQGTATIDLLTYSDKGAGFWSADTLSYESLKDGRFTFALPSELRLGQGDPATGAEATAARHRNAIVRYRAAVAAVHGQMRFIGFPAAASGNRPNVGVQELFVPLRFSVRGREKKNKPSSLSTPELLALLAPGKKKIGRVVVLGEPGSGKTTLCRFAAAAYSGELSEPGVPLRGEPLPLFLPFRDYVRRCRERGECGLVEYLVDQAKNHLQVGSIDEVLLEETLSHGRAILFLDGLDEVGSADQRVEMRDRIAAFCSQYPRLPVLLTSRIAGYEEAPLREGEFETLELKPFEDEDLRVFVSNWYAVQEKNDPQARERGIADLLAAIAYEPRVRALASNPLLATLIALVHRSEAKLPGERAKLYELCVRTLLETWPSQAKRLFEQIDEGLQRAYLEDFALAQQEKRSKPEAEVSFERTELVESLQELLGRQQSSASKVALRQTAEAWVEYLAAGTGLIVEQRPGVFAFLHLSLLEYLAACALDRQEEELEEKIARLQDNAVWREVLLLAVGRHATDLPFLERLFIRLMQDERAFFLLLCLREEAAFDGNSRATILAAAAKALLALWPFQWSESEEIVRAIERFSTRHGEETRHWRKKQLASALGEELRASVALSFEQPGEILEILGQRTDRSQAAADLLEYFPHRRIGYWAAEHASPAQVLGVFQNGPSELCLARALASFEPKTPAVLASALSRLQVKASGYFSRIAKNAILELSEQKRSGGRGLPERVGTSPLRRPMEVTPGWPRKFGRQQANQIFYSARDFSLDFSREVSRQFFQEAFQGFSNDYSRIFIQRLTRYLSMNFSQYFKMDFSQDFSEKFFPNDYRRLTIRRLNLYLGKDFIRDSTQGFALDFSNQNPSARKLPDFSEIDVDRKTFRTYLTERNHSTAKAAARATTSRRAAEAWIALATTARSSREVAVAYMTHRLQSVSLLYLWPAVDEALAPDPDPERLALYLQLGWTQSTTTHEWPATERWIALMKAGPPAHWLPRAQWHLCWLLAEPENETHQQAFNEALREGLADSDLGRHALAEELEAVIGFY